jgi:hypothetical protein
MPPGIPTGMPFYSLNLFLFNMIDTPTPKEAAQQFIFWYNKGYNLTRKEKFEL